MRTGRTIHRRANSVRKYPCGYCGKKSPADEMVYSTHTGTHYCGHDFDACRRRGAKASRARVAERRAERAAKEMAGA